MIKKQAKRMLNEEREDSLVTKTDNNVVDKINLLSATADLIEPVVFLGEGNVLTTNQPYVEPMYQFSAFNNMIGDKKLNSLSVQNLFYMNNYNIESLLNKQVVQYIRSHSFINFCAYLNNIGINKYGILEFIPVREFAKEYIQNANLSPTSMIRANNDFSMFDNIGKEINDVIDVFSLLLSNQICFCISKAVDDAVNYSLFMRFDQNKDLKVPVYDKVVNIINLQFYNELSHYRELYGEEEYNRNFDVIAASVVKNAIIYNMPSFIMDQLEPCIKNVLRYIPISGFNVFGDYRKYKFKDKAERENPDDLW